MVECGQRILDYTAEGGREAFLARRLLQDAVMRNFEVLGEAAKRVSPATRDKYPDLPWRRMAGLRDVLIHGYEAVVPEEVWAVVEGELPRVLKRLRDVVRAEGWG